MRRAGDWKRGRGEVEGREGERREEGARGREGRGRGIRHGHRSTRAPCQAPYLIFVAVAFALTLGPDGRRPVQLAAEVIVIDARRVLWSHAPHATQVVDMEV